MTEELVSANNAMEELNKILKEQQEQLEKMKEELPVIPTQQPDNTVINSEFIREVYNLGYENGRRDGTKLAELRAKKAKEDEKKKGKKPKEKHPPLIDQMFASMGYTKTETKKKSKEKGEEKSQ